MIVVTGATGKLGTLILNALLARMPAERIGASTRDPDKAEGLARAGVRVRHGDFADGASLHHAFEGATFCSSPPTPKHMAVTLWPSIARQSRPLATRASSASSTPAIWGQARRRRFVRCTIMLPPKRCFPRVASHGPRSAMASMPKPERQFWAMFARHEPLPRPSMAGSPGRRTPISLRLPR